jgi:penicillin-binding protein 1A
VVQGGSTITQQLAKNLFLTNERSIERKIKEAFLALWLEQRLTKQEILSLYLDRAYMGGGVFGIQAAAQFYFGKNVQDVTLAEAAMLAGLFKAPTKFAPHINLPAARARANDVLNNMVEAGFLTENQILAAKRNPATAIANGDSESPDYYLDYAFQEMKKLAAGGKFGNETALVVKTSFDPDIQRQTDVAMEQTIREEGESRNISQGAAVIMEPDGAIRALYGGRDYGESQFNRATNALRQPGSSFKPYVYAAALNTGQFEPETRVSDRRTCIGDWCPQNYTKSYSGQMSLSTALARSINTIPVQLTTAIGNGSNRNGRTILIDMVHRLGIDTNIVSVPSLPLGSTELTVLDQATGFSVFANGGQKMGNYAAVEVRDLKGTLIYTHDKDGVRPEKVLSTDIVGKLNRMMSRVVSEGTGTRARLPGLVAAGKTGSTSSYKDIWFVGYTAQMVGAVWFGNDDTSPMREGTTGGLIAAPTWRMIMEFAHEGRPVKPLPGFESGADTLSAPKPEKAPAGEGIVAVSRAPTMSRRSADAIVALDGLLRDGIVRSTGGVQTIAKPDNAILGITPIEPLQR